MHTYQPPLRAIRPDKGHWLVVNERNDIVVSLDSACFDHDDEEYARLFAAAPELLAACQAAREYILDKDYGARNEAAEASVILGQLQAAIAKATNK